MATVRDIMETGVATVHPEDDIETVLRTLRRHEVPGVPVVDYSDRVLGIITEADLVLSDEEADLHLPHYFELFGGLIFLESVSRFEDRLRKAVAAKARDLMTEDPITIGPDATVEEAARVIARRRHNRLPVVEDERLVGMVTRLDVLDALTADGG
jgi:CBS domain-containing protein